MPECRNVMIVSPASATNLTSTRVERGGTAGAPFDRLPPEGEHKSFKGHELDELALHDSAALRIDSTDPAGPRIESAAAAHQAHIRSGSVQ